jgi:hypothetical protein
MLTLKRLNGRTASVLRSLGAYSARERQYLLSEILQVRGLMPLLMKSRNRQAWTAGEKAELAAHLKRLSRLSPYLAVIIIPGGFLMLPVIAWWLDRRRKRGGRRAK